MTKKIFVPLSFILIVFVFILYYISSNRSNDGTVQQTIQQEKISNSVIEDEAFTIFWQSFKEAVLNKDILKLSELTQFPFTDFYNDIYDPSTSLTSKDEVIFKDKFDLIFDEYTINAIKSDNYRGYDENHSSFGGDVIDKGDYLLLTKFPNRFKDLLFQKIDNRYLLIGIQYYE